jgi:hypothetical protein
MPEGGEKCGFGGRYASCMTDHTSKEVIRDRDKDTPADGYQSDSLISKGSASPPHIRTSPKVSRGVQFYGVFKKQRLTFRF